MKRAIRYRTLTLVASLVAGGFIALAACSNQGEGERCDLLNGNDDCKTNDGLICYDGNLLNGRPTGARCCPSDRATATQPVCQTSVDISGADAIAPADTGPPTPAEAGVTDADASPTTDAGSDAADAAEGG